MEGLARKYQEYVVEKKPIPESDPDVRQEVLDSWRRMRTIGTNRRSVQQHVPKKELEKILKENDILLKIGHSYLENLYQYMDDATVLLSMEDKNGVVIDHFGSMQTLSGITNDTGMYLGCLRSEAAAGTNGISMALRLGRPFQVRDKEHYYEVFHGYVGTAAPIRDEQNRVIGSVGSVTPMSKSEERQKILLAMISSIADAISNEYSVKKAYEHVDRIRDQLSTTIEAMSSGVVVVDSDGIITMCNGLAGRQLGIKGDVPGRPVDDIIAPKRGIQKISDTTRDIHSVEYNIMDGGRLVKNLSVSIAQIGDADGVNKGKVLVLEDLQRVHSLVGRLSGYRANYTFESIIGQSPKLMRTKEIAKTAAASMSNVLLLGESGTGKELFAQAIHNASDRSAGPFVAINCASLPRELIESELFGYAPGAFTGASRSGQPGKFELADGGTIFLDEIGDMPISLQTSLLRVLQTRVVSRLGDSYERPVDVRVITATNINLTEAVSNSSFRGDLYYRLNVLSIEIPPLRERKDDIPLLAMHFLLEKSLQLRKAVKRISPEAMDLLQAYRWPGNVRELENVIERTVNLTNAPEIVAENLPSQILAKDSIAETAQARTYFVPQPESAGKRFLEELTASLERTGGNITRTAEELGISKRTLYRKIEKYGVNISDFRY